MASAHRTILQLQHMAGNQGVLHLLGKTPAPATADPAAVGKAQPVSAEVVQRVTRVDKKFVMPERFAALAAFVQEVVEGTLGETWTPELKTRLETWLTSREHLYNFAHLQDLIQFLLDGESSLTAKEKIPITEDLIKQGHVRRQLERFGILLEPFAVQTPATVPGMANIPNRELLRLGEIKAEEQEYWVRPSDDDLALFKRKGITKEDEHRVIATGDKDDPSYVVWAPKMSPQGQRGHRYKAGGGRNDSKNRTYGNKKEREGVVYKISGAVDGHSVQAQDNQVILGPFRAEAMHWKSTIVTTDGTTTIYDDAKYLPAKSGDTVYIELHPYNMYWENQQQGKGLRQKSIEAPALKNKTSFLHYNDYSSGDTATPNDDKLATHTYPVANTIHYLIVDDQGKVAHHIVDNRLSANYSDPGTYDKKTHKYSDISGEPAHNKNRTLGGESAYTHLDWSKQTDTSTFPSATVLETKDDAFEFKPEWRTDTTLFPAYQSPPGSPFHIPAYMEDDEKVIPGQHYRGEFIDDMLVNEATYDKKKKETKVRRTKIPKADLEQLKKALDLEKFKQGYKRKHEDKDKGPEKKKARTEPALVTQVTNQ